ncbi:MAG: TonB family protein [candidate division KSB1 bacterium]|nr:TonB family protein [candidate division KSB1 bacterium]MDZ7334993.1 TonB family protein [candidate division KSB1 bacterium]MDZ7357130.1 TonB family protein [candidate division KSB1 bacterium]MDZ7376613.1 TonB family protein [candidate division KSB1 bacterium]
MKHDSRDRTKFEVLKDLAENEKSSAQTFKVGTSQKIEKFPAEFKKGILQSIDLRFLLILLFSLVLNVSFIFLLRRMVPMELTSKAISNIQERYAKLLLKEGSLSYPSFLDRLSKYENRIDPEVITGLTRWMSTYTDNFIESIAEIPAARESKGSSAGPLGPRETSLPSREDLLGARSTATAQRRASRAELEQQMSSVGLLGLISSNTRAADREYVEDLLEYASENSEHLSEVLSRLSAIEVPRYGSSHYLRRLKDGDDSRGIGSDEALLKGGRITANEEKQQAIENVKPIETVQAKPAKRNLNYEPVPTSEEEQAAITQKRVKTRSAQDVMRVVQSHTRALQDCYKQELRYAPNISGKITVRFVVDPDGNVKDVALVSSTLNSPRMEQCIINRIKRWRDFPPCDPSVGDKTYRQSFSFGEKN